MKLLAYHCQYVNRYFWRTHDQAEIDYIEEKDGILNAFELKWKNQKVRFPSSFTETYPCTTKLISLDNYTAFLSDDFQ